MPEPLYAAETAIVRRVAADPYCEFIWTTHAKEQMAARGVSAPDVITALTNGQVTLHELKRDLLWRVEGLDVDGRPLTVIVTVYENEITIKIVTAF